MHFVDYAKIHIRSGKGGDGCVSFRREKFVPLGGPDGGDGGNGGDVYFRGSPGKSTLLDFRYRQHYRAGDGSAGRGKDRHGRNGEPLTIEVPLGTVVRAAKSGPLLAEVLDETPQLCLRGGRGGRGNPRFKTSAIRAPGHCEEGAPPEECWVELELKLIADVGLVGFPNAGKSTLISAVSKARPRIADYPFTTLVPNLGVVHGEGFESYVMADIPGIIKGAHAGTGLGHRFLRHIERTTLLLLLIDCTLEAGQAVSAYDTLLEEMGLFSALLPEKPRAVALTKLDLNPGQAHLRTLRDALERRSERVFAVSAVSGAGLAELLRYLAGQVFAGREAKPATAPAPRSGASTPHS